MFSGFTFPPRFGGELREAGCSALPRAACSQLLPAARHSRPGLRLSPGEAEPSPAIPARYQLPATRTAPEQQRLRSTRGHGAGSGRLGRGDAALAPPAPPSCQGAPGPAQRPLPAAPRAQPQPGGEPGRIRVPRVAVAAPPRHSPSACSREFMAAAGQRAGPSRPLTAPPPPPAARPGPTPQQCRALLGSPPPARHAPFSKRGSHSPERALRGGAGGGAGSVGGGCGGARSSARRRRLRAPGPGMRPLSGACGPAPGPVALRGAAATAGGCPRAAPGGAPCTVPSPEPRVPAASRCPGGALGYPGRQLPPVTAPRVTERCARGPGF